MNPVKLRRLLVNIHLILAAFMAPAFLLVAISGGLDHAGVEAKVDETPIELPAGTLLDFESPDLEADVRALFASQGINIRLESLRGRGASKTTFPTSRPHVKLTQTPEGLKATLNRPNLQSSLMELHKGHGPGLFKVYSVFVALLLFFVVLGGLTVGLLAPAYRRLTLITAGIGAVVFGLLAFLV